MKNNKQIEKDMANMLKDYYSKAISNNIKRAFERKRRLSTIKNCNVKRCKV
ncbi:MAG: hypothetical protein KBB75_01125 [Candidatus Pacebacteria bacterium]|nr:hypothetical protein [Candidatus Paceibacterota bacterium]